MKKLLEPQRRSLLSRGGRVAAGLLFLLLGAVAFFVNFDPAWFLWVHLGLCLAGFLVILFWKSAVSEQSEEEQVLEVVRQALHHEGERLDKKRIELEKVLMSYGEWREFPDFEKLQNLDWRNETHARHDEQVAEIVEREAQEMLERFSSRAYWDAENGGRFDARKLLLDLFTLMEDIARIHQPDSDRPLLETNLEELLRAVNRASLQIILLLDEVPLIELQNLNLRQASDFVSKAAKVHRKYQELEPILSKMRLASQGGKLLIAGNPLLAGLWIAGSELIWRGGKKLGKKAFDAYLLSLVHQTLGILARETAAIYDPGHRYRDPNWVFGVELAELFSRFDASGDTLRKGFRELGKLPLRSCYDRLYLYRCVARRASPKPGSFAQAELLSGEAREEIRDRLLAFHEKHFGGEAGNSQREYRKWREKMEVRLGMADPT